MPALFIGHGSPMNAIEENEFSKSWSQMGIALQRPRAILCISAHWETSGVYVTAMDRPRTIHDFYGFPQKLYEVSYPASGSPELATAIVKILGKSHIMLDHAWGLDHGCWSVLYSMFPDADIPVIQLSLDRSLEPQGHYNLGKQLSVLREQGVLVLGSGNMVHNLGLLVWEDIAFDWAVKFDAQIIDCIEKDDHNGLIRYEGYGDSAILSVNSGEHFLPLLYILAMKEKDEPHVFFTEKIWGGSVSMRSMRIG